MNYSRFCLKSLRFVYKKIFGKIQPPPFHKISDPQTASDLIYHHLMSDKPCMIARFGSTELMAMVNYIGVHNTGRKSILKFIQGKEPEWWWNENCLLQMRNWSGFFPPTVEKIEQFCEMMFKDLPLVDILGSWLPGEQYFDKELNHVQRVVGLEPLNPFFSEKPWTRALEDRKILVVHPFESSIKSQYKKRAFLFENQCILPVFDLKTIKAVQSLGGVHHDFADWFEALEHMKTEIDNTDYDVCLLGCGAYGFPLAAHVKRKGKKAVHLGGSLQLLFGIRGKRWESSTYSDQYDYSKLMNSYWVRPCEEELPSTAKKIEGGCYW